MGRLQTWRPSQSIPVLALVPIPGPNPFFGSQQTLGTFGTVNHLTRTSQAINVYVSLDDDSFI